MKTIVLLIALIFQLSINANDIEEVDTVPLKEYISMISNDLNMTIVISDEIEENFTLMIPIDEEGNTNLTNSDYLKILVQILKKNDLTIEPHDKFFMISRDKNENEKKELQFVKLNFVDYDTIKPLFKTVNDVNHSYISSNKTIVFKSTNKKFKRIAALIRTLDITPKQLKLKVTILDTNLDKLKDYGTELKQLNTFTADNNFFFNLLAYPFRVTSEVDETKTNQLHSFIHFMDTNKLTTIKSSPTVSLFDNRVSKFNLVKNIPYSTGTTSINTDNTVSSTTSTKYKDVGLKLKILPQIYSNNTYLDIDIVSENLTDKSDTPTTSSLSFNYRINISKNKIFVLTGLNQTQNYRTVNSTPVLSDVPFLGWLFKLDNKNEINSNLTIFLELIDDDKVLIPKKKVVDLKEIKTINDHQKNVNEILGI